MENKNSKVTTDKMILICSILTTCFGVAAITIFIITSVQANQLSGLRLAICIAIFLSIIMCWINYAISRSRFLNNEAEQAQAANSSNEISDAARELDKQKETLAESEKTALSAGEVADASAKESSADKFTKKKATAVGNNKTDTEGKTKATAKKKDSGDKKGTATAKARSAKTKSEND